MTIIIMLYSLFRLKDYHQRSAECRQTIGGGHDAHHLLPDGLCPICTSGNITIAETESFWMGKTTISPRDGEVGKMHLFYCQD